MFGPWVAYPALALSAGCLVLCNMLIELLLHKQIRILRLQALDGGQRFQRKIIKRLLRGLVDDDVALMRIVVFLGIPSLAVAGVDISGLGITWSL